MDIKQIEKFYKMVCGEVIVNQIQMHTKLIDPNYSIYNRHDGPQKVKRLASYRLWSWPCNGQAS